MLNHLIDIAVDWAKRCFGAQMDNLPERALRHVEEAIELCQAVRVPKEKVIECLEIVYAKPPGDPEQEMGGTLLTAFLFAAAHNNLQKRDSGVDRDPLEYFVRELRRVLAKPPKHFTDRNQEKVDLGLGVRPDDTYSQFDAFLLPHAFLLPQGGRKYTINGVVVSEEEYIKRAPPHIVARDFK